MSERIVSKERKKSRNTIKKDRDKLRRTYTKIERRTERKKERVKRHDFSIIHCSLITMFVQ